MSVNTPASWSVCALKRAKTLKSLTRVGHGKREPRDLRSDFLVDCKHGKGHKSCKKINKFTSQ